MTNKKLNENKKINSVKCTTPVTVFPPVEISGRNRSKCHKHKNEEEKKKTERERESIKYVTPPTPDIYTFHCIMANTDLGCLSTLRLDINSL